MGWPRECSIDGGPMRVWASRVQAILWQHLPSHRENPSCDSTLGPECGIPPSVEVGSHCFLVWVTDNRLHAGAH